MSAINCLIFASFSLAAQRKIVRWQNGELWVVFFQSPFPLEDLMEMD